MSEESLEQLNIRLEFCNFCIKIIQNDRDPRTPGALELLREQKSKIMERIAAVKPAPTVVQLRSAVMQLKVKEN